MSEVDVGLKHSRGAWRAAVAPTGETFSEDSSPEGVLRLAGRIGELRPAAVLVQALGGGELPVVVALLEQGVRVRVTSKEQVQAFAATTGAGLSGATTVAEMAGTARLLGERMKTQEGDDERVHLLLARRRQVLEMRAQEEERLPGIEYAPIREDLERHLFFLDRQLVGLHERLLYLVQVVLPRER
ncbi:hypothetical protein [Deinococcus aestuarii]|uniref:hypothetical protein n=1 Tax=Deinococcus aestuarii TaxID=2774531 RepID=UPI001C0C8431|nr:hypothetical protein [Deinococcus aestuarii]